MQGQNRILGTPVPFSWGGREFQIAPWDFMTEATFATWVETRARKRLQAIRKELGEDEYREQSNALREAVDAGKYEWGTRIVVGAWQSHAGSKHLVYLTLSKLDKTVTPKWIDELAADKQAWGDLWDLLVNLNFPPAEPAPIEGAETAEAGATN